MLPQKWTAVAEMCRVTYSKRIISRGVKYVMFIVQFILKGEQNSQVNITLAFGLKGPRFDPWQQPLVQPSYDGSVTYNLMKLIFTICHPVFN